MIKKLALVSTRYEIVYGFRTIFSSGCRVAILTDFLELRNFLFAHSPDFILIDIQIAEATNTRFSSMMTTISSVPFYYITVGASKQRLPDSVTVLHFPEDIPLLLQKSIGIADSFSATQTKILARLIGDSKAIAATKKNIALAARSAVPVLITGETGVGKGLCAELIHCLSPRAPRPMERINVTSIPDGLAEATLFGTVRGAFTDAVNREGCFERARGTTLFLDEIGELKIDMQKKLLYTIENGTFRNVGADVEKHSDARLIFATNADLKAKRVKAEMRDDFYYRISHFCIHIPPLRERKEDIVPLARHFAAAAHKRLSYTAESLLTTCNWKGNARQLANCIERASLLCGGDTIDVQHIVVD